MRSLETTSGNASVIKGLPFLLKSGLLTGL